MKCTGGIINPEINKEISKLSHFDLLLLADAGMSIADSCKTIDISFVPGIPDMKQVSKEIFHEMCIQKVYIAEEIAEASPDLYRFFVEEIGNEKITLIPYSEFRKMSFSCRTAIKTSEYVYHYSSVIIEAGCAY